MLERVEVLKGPGSVLYGETGSGGIINMVSKRPNSDHENQVEAGLGSYGRKSAKFDLGGPISGDGDFLYRIVGGVTDGGTALYGRDHTRTFIAPSVTWQPSDTTSFTVFSHYLHDDGRGDLQNQPASGTILPNPNGWIPINRSLGDPNFEGFEREQWGVGYNLEHEFTSDIILRQTARLGGSNIDERTLFGFGLVPGSDREWDRAADESISSLNTFNIDTHLQINATTGPLDHKILVGIDYARLNARMNFSTAFAPPIDIYDPVYGVPIDEPLPFSEYKTTFNQLGIYAQDEVEIDRLTVVFGGRVDWTENEQYSFFEGDPAGSTTSAQADGEFSGRVGMSYDLGSGFHPYLSYSTAFIPTSGADFDGNAFSPKTSSQWEAGIKYQPEGAKGLLSASVFQIDRRNVLTNDPDPTHICAFVCQVQGGEARVRGIELEAKVEILPETNLIASYSRLTGEYTKGYPDAFGTDIVGNDLDQIPDHQFALWADHKVTSGPASGLSLGAGIRHIGSYNGDPQNTLRVPGVTLLDASIGYDFGEKFPELTGLALSINGSNLTNERYAVSCTSESLCYYGEGLRVSGTLSYRW